MRHGDYACAILWRDGRLLLGLRSAHRATYPNCWDVLGGLVEPGETLQAALARELQEELGVTPLSARILGVIDEPDPRRNGCGRYHVHLVTAWVGGEPAIRDDEHVRLDWFTPAEAAQLSALALEEYRRLFAAIAD